MTQGQVNGWYYIHVDILCICYDDK